MLVVVPLPVAGASCLEALLMKDQMEAKIAICGTAEGGGACDAAAATMLHLLCSSTATATVRWRVGQRSW